MNDPITPDKPQAVPRPDLGGWISGPSLDPIPADWPAEARRLLSLPAPHGITETDLRMRQALIIIEQMITPPDGAEGTIRGSVAGTAVDLAAVLGRLESGMIHRRDAELILRRLSLELEQAAAMCGGTA